MDFDDLDVLMGRRNEWGPLQVKEVLKCFIEMARTSAARRMFYEDRAKSKSSKRNKG